MASEFVWMFFSSVYFHIKEWLYNHPASEVDTQVMYHLTTLLHITNPNKWTRKLPTDADGEALTTILAQFESDLRENIPDLWAKIDSDATTYAVYSASEEVGELTAGQPAESASKLDEVEEEDEEEEEELVLPFHHRQAQAPPVLDADDDDEEEEDEEEKVVIKDDLPQPEVEELPDLPELKIVQVDYSSDDEQQPVVPCFAQNQQEPVAAETAAAATAPPSTPKSQGVKRNCPSAPVQPRKRIYIYKVVLEQEDVESSDEEEDEERKKNSNK